VQQIKIMPDMCTHLISMAASQTTSCIPLLIPSSKLNAFYGNTRGMPTSALDGRLGVRLSNRTQ
jgi:hypothetical protein